MFEKLVTKIKNFPVARAVVSVFSFGMTFGATGVVALASGGSSTPSAASLTDTLETFTEVFDWFLQSGGDLLAWMLDKPIILLSLAIFFVGAVVGVLARIYSSF